MRRQNVAKMFPDRKLVPRQIAVENKWKLQIGFSKTGKWLAGTV
jgi:hypothetical protein